MTIIYNGSLIKTAPPVTQYSSAWAPRSATSAWMSRATDPRDILSRGGATITTAVGHWSAGPIREGEAAATQCVSAMRARKRKDGSDMSVSAHFMVGWDGLVWQLCDIADATIHTGSRKINRTSVGIETAWPGTKEQALRIAAAIKRNGRKPHPAYYGPTIVRNGVELLAPSEALVAGFVRLVGALKTVLGRELECIEHCDVSTKKIDACGLLKEAVTKARALD